MPKRGARVLGMVWRVQGPEHPEQGSRESAAVVAGLEGKMEITPYAIG